MPRLIFSDYNNLILKIYEAGIEPELWKEVALEISDRMHSGETQLLILDNEKKIEKFAASARYNRACQEEYLKNYYPHDLRVKKLFKKYIGALD